MIVIGIDPHMKSHTAVALDGASGRRLAECAVAGDAVGCEELLAWARRLDAEADVLDAALWYEQRSPGLGTEFLRAVDVTLAEITRMPERFPLVHREARRALLRRFPYAVYFVATPDLVSVVACMHARRDPRRWEERVGG